MTRSSRLVSAAAWISLSSAILPLHAYASGGAQAAPDQDKSTPNPGDQPAAKPQDQPQTPPAAAPATDPNLAVASVKLEGGYRASKVVGAAVYNSDNQQIGTVDDLILNHENQVSLAVVSVGGFLGVGGKLVALPYGKIERADNGKVILADGSKENLAKLPSFTYSP